MKTKFAGNADGLKAELKRIEGMSGSKVKPELQQWMARRKKILAQMSEKEL